MSSNQKNESSDNSKNQYDGLFKVVCILVIPMVVITAIAKKIQSLQYQYFEEMYFSLYLVAVAICAFGFYRFLKMTKDLKRRYLRLKPFRKNDQNTVLVGRSIKEGVNIFISNLARCGQVQIIAATGRGKTESVILPWLLRDLWNGWSGILIDGKGDPKLVKRIEKAIPLIKKTPHLAVFDLSHPERSVRTNPLASGSAQQITDRLFTAFEFQDPFYKSVQYREAGILISLIQDTGDGVVTFKKLHALLTDTKKLAETISAAKDPAIKEKAQRLLRFTDKEREQNLLGLISQIEPFATGEVAPLVNGEVPGFECLSISDVVLGKTTPTVFVFLISTLKFQELGRQLGKLLLQELAWAVGERAATTGEDSPFLPVFMDEFSAFVYPGFYNVLNKARSSKVALHLSHQSIGDLKIVDLELAGIINTNTNVKCLLGLNDPETADFFARHLGTESSEKFTERAEEKGLFGMRKKTGDLSIREVEAYRIHPNKLKNFTNGRGVISIPTEEGTMTEEIQFENIEII